MRKVLLVLFAIVAVATVEAKPISKTPVGCWSFVHETEPKTYSREGEGQDTLLTLYRTDYDSLVLCPKDLGLLEYRVRRQYVYTTEDGYEKVQETVYEYCIRFKWKYKKGVVQILSYFPDISCTYVERTSDNRGTKYPSHFNNNIDEEAVQFMIDLLPQLGLEYNPNNGHLYSHGFKGFFRHCKGTPSIYLTKETVI